jgi:hypothetical protein
MVEAFRLLEDNEQELGWRGMYNFTWAHGSNDLGSTGAALLAQHNPFDGPEDPQEFAARAEQRAAVFAQSVSRLSEALDRMEKARPNTQAKGKAFLAYLTSKTRAYAAHLEMIILLNQAFLVYARAFINHAEDEAALAPALDEAVRLLDAACRKSQDCARMAAEHVDHPSDLAILFLANVWNVNKAEEVLQLFRRVADYHHGRPYWKEQRTRADLGEQPVPL